MYKLDRATRVRILAALTEGNSIRATSRMIGVDRNTISDLLVEVGQVCAEFQDQALRNLPCKRIQADEISAYCYAKDKNLPASKQSQFGYGSVWTWTAIDYSMLIKVYGRPEEAPEKRYSPAEWVASER